MIFFLQQHWLAYISDLLNYVKDIRTEHELNAGLD